MSYMPIKRNALTGGLRNQKYDVLRAIAVLMVLSVHFAQNFSGNRFFSLSAPIFDLGKHGVKLFFVLSGYLMLRSLTNVIPTSKNYWRYIGKRFLRIYPAYIFSLVIFYIFSEHDLVQLLTHVFLVQTYSARTFGGINYAYWSLSVEFIIYFFLPYFIWKRTRNNIFKFSLMIIAASASWQIIGGFLRAKIGFDSDYNYSSMFYFITALPAFIIGMFYKELKENKLTGIGLKLISSLAICDVLLSILDCALDLSVIDISKNMMHGSIGYICYGALFARILHSQTSENRLSGFGFSLLAKLGEISYSIYLWHLPVLLFFVRHFGADFSTLCSALLSIILISMISYSLIEKTWVNFGSTKLKFDYIGGPK